LNLLFCSQSKNADDIVITYAARTPLTKAKKGGFKDTTLEYMIYALLKEVRERSKLDPALVEDICMGNVRTRPTMPLSLSLSGSPRTCREVLTRLAPF
jgi:acetyl-CoA acetyltransferase